MAQKITVSITCDLPEDNRPAEPVRFSLAGADYEMDLCVDHAKELKEKVAKFADHAHRVRRPTTNPHRPRTTAKRKRDTEIREWARQNNIEVSSRGRLPLRVIRLYEAQH